MSMSTENGRVALAEAMGWKVDIVTTNPVADEPIESWQSPDGSYSRFSPPDPFTDANDDYAVLEWMRDGDGKRYVSFQYALLGLHADYSCYAYRIGDYARAALMVLDND